MTFEVKTAVFEGPLDLLLQLITRHQVDISEVSLVTVVTDYVSYLDEMRSMDLDVTSEFLLIAATLIQLKARNLLPDDVAIDLDEDLALMEERDRLLARLLACVTFKDVAAVLAYRHRENNRFVARRAGMDEGVVDDQPREVIIGANVVELGRLAERVFARTHDEPDLDHLELDLPSVEEALTDLRLRVEMLAETTFEEMVDHCERKVEVVAYFLALLELARWGMVTVSQEDWLAEISIRHAQRGGPVASEWSA